MGVLIDILMIDESQADAALIGHVLRRAGWTVRCLRVDTREAILNALDSRRWDLVLCDDHLPGYITTSEAVELVADRAATTPVVILSDWHLQDVEKRLRSCAVAGILNKSKFGDLVACVTRIVGRPSALP